jgi:phosphoglycolate phosphatase
LPRLILFDIDGTLLSCGRQVAKIFAGALTEVFGGHGPLEGFSFAGKTDPMIVRELAGAIGLPAAAIDAGLSRMSSLYVERLGRELAAEKMRVLPGVLPLLQSLAGREEISIGLLTGNWRGGAEAKLGRVGLWEFFELGAFGEDAWDRRGLVPVALERAKALKGHAFLKEEALIVGDTALDVDCARASGVPCVGVATGFTSAEELRAAGADWVFSDLEAAARELPLFTG